MEFRRRWPLYLLLLAFALLGTRLAWTLAGSRLGWRPHLDEWVDVAARLVGMETTPLSDKTPEAQARFWLNEVSGVESVDEDPQVAMGAAWMLDTPHFDFTRRHFRVNEDLDFPGLPLGARMELDHDAIRALTRDFESLCRDECLAKIETAIGLDSADVELWRARALLVFQTKFASLGFESRRDDWLAVLDESAQHDPGNALYDYLAALRLWSSSADHAWEEDGYTLEIKDGETFNEANARLAAGLVKPHLSFGREGYAATLAFLDESSVSRSDHLTAARSREISGRTTGLLFPIMRWQSRQSDVEKRKGNFDAAVAAVRNLLTIADQISENGNHPYLTSPNLVMRQWALERLTHMHEDHSGLLNADESEQLSSELAEAQLDRKVMDEVGKRLARTATTGKSIRTDDASSAFLTAAGRLLAGLLMPMAQALMIVTLAFAVVSWLLARLCSAANNDDPVAMGWGRHVAAWIAGFGLSFLILGVSPAGIIPESVQSDLLRGLIWVGFALLLLGLAHLLRKRLLLPWSQLVLFVAITVLPIMLVFHFSATVTLLVTVTATLHPVHMIGLLVMVASLCWMSTRALSAIAQKQDLTRHRRLFAFGSIVLIALVGVSTGAVLEVVMSDQLVAEPWISPKVWKEAEALPFTAGELQSATKLGDSKWVWAFIQWLAHEGVLAAPLIASVVLIIWHLVRHSRRHDGGFREMLRSGKRSQIRHSGSLVARSCGIASLFFSLIYLGAAPTVAEMAETYYRVHHDRLVNSLQAWDEIEAESALIRLDHAVMRELRVEIAKRNRQIAEQQR